MALAGCQTPVQRAFNDTLNIGQSFPETMRDSNIAMVVSEDEKPFNEYGYIAHNYFYISGVAKGDPETRYRLVYLRMRNSDWALYIHSGEHAWSMAAYVPDQLPKLEEGDAVEIRQTARKYNYVLDDFLETGEGNSVIRVLCRFKDPDFSRCMGTMPRIQEYEGYGQTGSYYPASLKEYGFSYTPFYDEKGRQLRPHIPHTEH